MNILAVAEMAILKGPIISDLADRPEILLENELVPREPEATRKRFGINDLWRIHSGKRYVNIYHRRVGLMI